MSEVPLYRQEKQDAEEGLEESRENLGYQIRGFDSLLTKVAAHQRDW